MPTESRGTFTVERFGLSPLIRFTLISLYVALVLPLPLLAPAGLQGWMSVGLVLGLVLVLGLLSEQVETDEEGLLSLIHISEPTRPY